MTEIYNKKLFNKKQDTLKTNIESSKKVKKFDKNQKNITYIKKNIKINQKEEEKNNFIPEKYIKDFSPIYENLKNKDEKRGINNYKNNNNKIVQNADILGPTPDNSNFITNNQFDKNLIKIINLGIISKELKRSKSKDLLKNNNINNNIIIDKRKHINNSKPKYRLFNTKQIITLKNVEKITYMSSCIYCLINIYDIKYYFTRYLEIIQENGNKMPICYFFSRIIYHFFIYNNSDDNKYPINNFYYQIINQNPIFKAKKMRKSINFLIYLLEKIDDEDKQLANNLKSSNYNYSKIFHKFFLIQKESCLLPIFTWVNRKVKICWECGKIFKSFQKFFTYDIDIELVLNKLMIHEHKNELTIMDCINYLSERATLFNIYCRNCHQKTNFMKDSHIFLTQKVFTVLFREMENEEYINKIKNEKIKIKINESLDLSNIVKYKANQASLRYNINGMVMFDSENLEYIAYTINQLDGKWYKYFKENVFQVELKDFIDIYDFKIFPVILFYKQE
jgi:hypothetical protein